jgi:DNA-binding CsgD family transcriptional regulator
MFDPRLQLTLTLTRLLMSIEGDRQQVAALPVDVTMLASLRETAKLQATHHSTQIEGIRPPPSTRRQRRLLELFRSQGTDNSAEIAAHLGLSSRTVPALCRAWIESGFLAIHDPSSKNRAYRLGEGYEAAFS